MKWTRFAAVGGLTTVLIIGVLALKPVLEPPGHKTRRDHMDQLDRIESKIDELIEIGRKWE